MNSRKDPEPEVQNTPTPTSVPSGAGFALPEAMTGKASPAKAALGDKPVFSYIASVPQPQRGILEAIDVLASKTLPNLQRSV